MPGTGLGTLFNVYCLISTLQPHKSYYLKVSFILKGSKIIIIYLVKKYSGSVTKLPWIVAFYLTMNSNND